MFSNPGLLKISWPHAGKSFFSEALWESTKQVVKHSFAGKKILLINWG